MKITKTDNIKSVPKKKTNDILFFDIYLIGSNKMLFINMYIYNKRATGLWIKQKYIVAFMLLLLVTGEVLGRWLYVYLYFTDLSGKSRKHLHKLSISILGPFSNIWPWVYLHWQRFSTASPINQNCFSYYTYINTLYLLDWYNILFMI